MSKNKIDKSNIDFARTGAIIWTFLALIFAFGTTWMIVLFIDYLKFEFINHPLLIYTVLFTWNILIYYCLYHYCLLKRLPYFFQKSLSSYLLILELVGIFCLGLIIFTILGNNSDILFKPFEIEYVGDYIWSVENLNSITIDGLVFEFNVTTILLPYIAMSHYYISNYTSSIISSEVKEEMEATIKSKVEEDFNNEFKEMEAKIEQLEENQKSLSKSIERSSSFLCFLIAVYRLITYRRK